MKKLVFTICLLAFLSNSIFAQKSRLGFNGALTYSNFRGNSFIQSYDAGFDFLAGFTFEYQLKNKVSLVAAINYDRKSASQELYTQIIENPDDPAFAGDIKIKLKDQFITLPVLLKYEFGPNNSFYINGGPFVSYVLKSELSNDYDNSTINEKDNLKALDYGLVFGFGKTFRIKSNNELTIEFRENLGLADISALDGSVRTNSFNLACGYSFDLK